MINIKLIEHIFKAASISRWNDYPKMINLVELDKQAHKFIIAYFIASFEEDVDFNYIIEAGIFDFLVRIMITDIRPDVYHQILKTKKNKINEWVLSNLQDDLKDIQNGEFLKRFKKYLISKRDKKEDLILKAASYFATKWEFEIVYQTSKFLSDINEVKSKIDEELEDYYELIGVQKITLNKKIARLIDLSGRLRFQKRWAQTPRIPETSVLGHTFVVAILSYFFSLKIDACKNRLKFNFLCALFHDLPESLTRDIISPVKYGIKGLDEVINEYEIKVINEKILPFTPNKIYEEFSYILGILDNKKNEFSDRFLENNKFKFYKNEDINKNSDEFLFIDGRALKFCDRLSAFFEAGISISYGIKTKEIVKAFDKIYKRFEDEPMIENVNFYQICKDFKKYFEV